MIKELEKYKRENYKGDYFLIENEEWELIKGKYEQDVVKESLDRSLYHLNSLPYTLLINGSGKML